jgi:hypothetical protein
LTFEIKRIAFKAEPHIIMKILVEAIVRAPDLHNFVGGKNPPVFKGKFEVKFSEKFIQNVSRSLGGGRVLETEIRGLSVKIVKLKKKKGVMRCVGSLPSVSPRFFRKLQEQGWSLDQEAAALYRYPSIERERSLKDQIKRCRKDASDLLRSMKSLDRSYKRCQRSQKGKPPVASRSFDIREGFFDVCKKPKS